MIKGELNPPWTGLNADPVLFGVAAGLEALFPPVMAHGQDAAEQDPTSDGDEAQEARDAE